MSEPGRRHLIVNADDFGQTTGVNHGVAIGHEHGIVTSASLMVRWPAATPAANYARHRPQLSVGLHVDLCEWARRDGEWHPLYQVVDLADAAAVTREVDSQLARFRELTRRSGAGASRTPRGHRRPRRRRDALGAQRRSTPSCRCASTWCAGK